MSPPASDEERKARRDKVQAAHEQREEEALGVLSAQQKATLERMKGAKFDAEKWPWFPPGPGRK
jgi:hypothetical protein